MKKNGEGSKIISCSSVTRRDYLERWKERKHTKRDARNGKFCLVLARYLGEKEIEREERTQKTIE